MLRSFMLKLFSLIIFAINLGSLNVYAGTIFFTDEVSWKNLVEGEVVFCTTILPGVVSVSLPVLLTH